MIQIPETPGLQQTPVGMPTLDENAAAAPVRALGPLAQGLSALGEHFQGVAVKAQNIENARMESEARNKLATDYSQFQLGLQSDQDPASRIQKTQAFLSGAKNSLVTADMPPVVRERLGLHIGEFSAHASIQAGADAASLAEKRADEAANNEIETGINAQNRGMVYGAIDRLAAAGHKTPEEIAAMRQKANYHLDYRAAVTDLQADPLQAQANASDPKFLERYKTLTPEAQMALQRHAREMTHEKTLDLISQVHDGIATGYISEPAQVNEIGFGLHPSVLAELSNEVVKNQNFEEQARRATPEYQDATVGQITRMLADYQPAEKGYDAAFTRMDGLVRSLPSGSAVRTELEENIKAARSSGLSAIKTERDTVQKQAMGSIDDAAKAGHFGNLNATGTKKLEVATFLDAGFLRDAAKVGAHGFGDAQAALISDPPAAIKAKDLMAAGLDPASAASIEKELGKKGEVAGEGMREKLFRLLWENRKNPGMVTASPFEQSLAEAIRTHQSSFHWTDPEAEDAAITERARAEMAVGKAKTEMLGFLQANPKATAKEAADQLFKLAGDATRAPLQRSALASPPTAPGVAVAPPPIAANLTDFVKQFEQDGDAGWTPQAYWDSKQWSIGYGTRSREGETITHAEANKRLESELAQSRARVEAANSKLGLKLTENEADALTSFDYNTGALGTLLANGSRSKAEIAAAMPLYRNAGGQRLPGMGKRRAAEQALFLKGWGGKPGGVAFLPKAASVAKPSNPIPVMGALKMN